MAQGDHVLGLGLTLNYGPATGSESITLTDLVKVDFPEAELGKSDDSTLSDTIGLNSAGYGEPGKLSNQLYLTASQYAALLAVRQARVSKSWKIQLPKSPNQSSTGDKSQFTAWVSKIKINPAEKMKNDKLLYDLDLQQSGDETYTTGS